MMKKFNDSDSEDRHSWTNFERTMSELNASRSTVGINAHIFEIDYISEQ